jgi:ThiF family
MSHPLIARNLDLQRLLDDGYVVDVQEGYLVLRDIPYAKADKTIARGLLISTLELAGDATIPPTTHTVLFSGEYPCTSDGMTIESLRHGSATNSLGKDLTVHHSFSAKPKRGHYLDYFEKMTTYATLIESHAQRLDPTVTAQTKQIIAPQPDESPFHYLDTASARAGINIVNAKLAEQKIAIVGLGGTGSYVLDFVSNTHAREIHLFDGDEFSTHNAFRAPGAPTLDQLRPRPRKVAYFAEIYSQKRRGIIPHEHPIDEKTVDALRDMSFVFLCMDNGPTKGVIVSKLEEFRIPFADVGMGLYQTGTLLGGILRVTTSTEGRRETARKNIPTQTEDAPNEYDKNIQIAELNAMNAAFAVVKWKKLSGFYLDQEQEQFTSFTIGCNLLVSEDLL